MSEMSEQQATTRETGPCEKAANQVTRSSWNQHFNEEVLQVTIASTIDRLAADVAEVKAAVCGNHSKTSNSSPAAPQPAAPQAGWLTERERHVLSSMLSERPVDSSLHWAEDVQPVFRSILARAGSPPVVEVPTMFQCSSLRDYLVALQQFKDALDAAGVKWKEVGRE